MNHKLISTILLKHKNSDQTKPALIRKYLINFWFSRQGDDADENEAVLDEEMEKVFSEPNLNKFDVRRLSEVKPPSSSKLDKEYQQSQQPLNVNKYNEQDFECE